MERALIDQYQRHMKALTPALTFFNRPLAVQTAEVPDRIRAFGHVRAANAKQARYECKRLRVERQAFTGLLAQAA